MKFTPFLIATATLGLVGLISLAGPKSKGANVSEKIAEALPKTALTQPLTKRKILIFSVTKGFRHKSIDTAKIALQMLGDNTGAYESIISDDLSNFETDAIKEFDAICFLNTTLEVFLPSKEEQKTMPKAEIQAAILKSDQLKESFMSYIREGGAFVGIHSATDTFYDWPEYGEMIGGYFWGHPWRANSPVHIDVEPGAENNPIVAHLEGKPFNFKEEVYQFKEPYDSSKYDMLLRLDPSKSDPNVKKVRRTDNDFGVSWTKMHEKGRVFYCSIGHNHDMFWNTDVLKIYLNGIQWAMGDLKIQ